MHTLTFHTQLLVVGIGTHATQLRVISRCGNHLAYMCLNPSVTDIIELAALQYFRSGITQVMQISAFLQFCTAHQSLCINTPHINQDKCASAPSCRISARLLIQSREPARTHSPCGPSQPPNGLKSKWRCAPNNFNMFSQLNPPTLAPLSGASSTH